MHFRDHWTIPQYADALNTSTDRLHAVCQRVLGRSPLRLVHERLIQQACLLLERSALTVEQISNHLGFSDPAHFQRFFKKHLGEPPGAYRRDTEKAAAERREWRRHSTYADWP
jgi:AraC-like DNA-binding protein